MKQYDTVPPSLTGLAATLNRRQRRSIIGLTVIAALATMIGCSGSGSPTSSLMSMVKSEVGKTYSMSLHSRKAVIGPPSSGVYLGAYVNPSAVPSPSPSILEHETEQLESSSEMNRTLALHLEYRNWTKMAALSTADPQIAGDIANHRAPLISWTCADDIVPSPMPTGWHPYNLIQIAHGDANADITKIKTALANINAPGKTGGYPIMLRWFWEFNINASQVGSPYANSDLESINEYSDANGNGNCFVKPGTITNIPNPGSTAPSKEDQFKNAWIQIYNTFTGTLPAPPVTFVWNPNVATPLNGYPDAQNYFPGSSYVDWIAADGYAKLDGSTPQSFTQIFKDWYSEYDNATFGSKPLMIGETGSCQTYVSPQQTQPQYISGIQTLFDSNASPTFPVDIKAVNYFDAHGAYAAGGRGCIWSFDPDGLSAWETLGHDLNFTATVPGT